MWTSAAGWTWLEFTNVPGGTASWVFTDVTGNYNDESGSAAIVISQADAPVVSALAGPSSGVRGQTLTFAGSFADPNEDNWTATVQYGDGTASQPLVLERQ